MPLELSASLSEALRQAGRCDGPVLVTGSLYLVGEARELLAGERPDPLATADPLPGPRGDRSLEPAGLRDVDP